MSIELHCNHCSRLIRAPDDAGGKHGKCPYCKGSVYVPMPADEREEIGLSPVDPEEERREEELRREAIAVSADVDHDTGRAGAGRSALGAGETIDVPAEVQRYVMAMHQSKLDVAEKTASRLARVQGKTRDYVEGLLNDQMAAPIGSVPRPLANGFLKKLLHDIG